jgi:hypothetical protein
VFKAIAEFQPYAHGEDEQKLAEIDNEKSLERRLWYEAAMDEARSDLERKLKAPAFAALVKVVVYGADAKLAHAAAQEMVKFDDFELRMRGYKQDQPGSWREMMNEPLLASWAKQKNLQ